MTAARLTKRTAALGAVLALLLAGLWGLGNARDAKADITVLGLDVTVASTSPPPGGEIYYGLTISWNEDPGNSAPTPFQVVVSNLGGFDIACPSANPQFILPTGIVAGSTPCQVTGFGSTLTFNFEETDGTSGTNEPLYIGLTVSSSATPGTTLQPTFTVLQGLGTANRTAPVRTVDVPTVTVSPADATVGNTVTFTFTLPAGWLCQSDTLSTRACADGADPDGIPDDLSLTTNLNYVSNTLSSSSVGSSATFEVGADITGAGLVKAELDVKYVGDEASAVGAGDDYDPTTNPSASLEIWIHLVVPGTQPSAGGTLDGSDIHVYIGNADDTLPATSAVVTLSFGSEITDVTVTSDPTGWDCSASGNTITCITAPTTTIPSGAGVHLFDGNGDLSVTLTANAGEDGRTITVNASVTLYYGATTRTEATTETFSQGGLDLEVSGSADPLVVASTGGLVMYTFTLESTSSPTLGNVVVTIDAPAGTALALAIGGDDFTCSAIDADTAQCTASSVTLSTTPTKVADVFVSVPKNVTSLVLTQTASATATFDYGSASGSRSGAGTAYQFAGPGTVTYNLVFGWNLITWAGENEVPIDSPNGLGSILDNISSVYTFEALTQEWRFWFPDGGPVNTLATLQTGTAYFIYVTAPGGVTLTVPAGP